MLAAAAAAATEADGIALGKSENGTALTPTTWIAGVATTAALAALALPLALALALALMLAKGTALAAAVATIAGAAVATEAEADADAEADTTLEPEDNDGEGATAFGVAEALLALILDMRLATPSELRVVTCGGSVEMASGATGAGVGVSPVNIVTVRVTTLTPDGSWTDTDGVDDATEADMDAEITEEDAEAELDAFGRAELLLFLFPPVRPPCAPEALMRERAVASLVQVKF